MKKVLSLTLVCLLLIIGSGLSSISASAADSVPVPYMLYIANSSCDLYISSSGTATVDATIVGYQGTTTKVDITANLQQYKNGSWVTLKTFTSTSATYRADLSETYNVSTGYSYRIQATVKAYSGSASETQTMTSSVAKY